MNKLILLRHGESLWNKENIFTGWTDIELSNKGIKEAKKAGKILQKKKIIINYSYTSVLKRAIHTLWYVLNEMNLIWINNFKTWRLNERHYGTLQGENKNKIRELYGKKKVKEWRRSYKISPPKIKTNDHRYPGNELKYKNLNKKDIPLGESLLDTFNRLIPFWKKNIIKKIKKYKSILIVAHGNSLRALIKHIENISDKNISKINIKTGHPIIYKLDNNMSIINKY